ncbi:MAG TPA: hypothetical protein DD490_30155 [Acidobacteria bacterium]|nr:hypothetical protein [Acidobacteriota bacterium]
MRHRFATLIFAVLIGVVQPPQIEGQHIEVAVNLFQRPTGDIYSSAVATCFDFLGRYDQSCILVGSHEIRDTATQGLLGYRDFQIPGEYNNFLSRGPRPNHCYRTQIIARKLTNFQVSRGAGTFEVCAEAPSDPEVPEENCPILLDLGLDGFHLSGPDPAVAFDIDADGEPNRISWTRAGDDDAFLCLDRNQNGTIDDGSELFGYATPLVNGQNARIGYVALGELDALALGGNDDGKVNAADVLFQSLCVWNDFDRDGVSGPGELRSAAAAGVVSLDYGFRVTRRTDSHGNLFRYVSRAELRTGMGQVRNWITYDVIFANAEP